MEMYVMFAFSIRIPPNAIGAIGTGGASKILWHFRHMRVGQLVANISYVLTDNFLPGEWTLL